MAHLQAPQIVASYEFSAVGGGAVKISTLGQFGVSANILDFNSLTHSRFVDQNKIDFTIVGFAKAIMTPALPNADALISQEINLALYTSV